VSGQPELERSVPEGRPRPLGGACCRGCDRRPERGMLVNEVNHTMEFHTVQPLSGIDIEVPSSGYTVEMASKKG